MKQYLSIIFAIIFLSSCTQKKYATPHVLINTSYGDVIVELMPANAPISVAAFLSYVDSGFYKNGSFYRVLSNDNVPQQYNTGLIQGGLFTNNQALLDRIPGIAHEPTSVTHLSHSNGTISLARTKPGTASTEFFICVGDQTQFDSNQSADSLGFAAFGKVVEGMDVVRQIQNNPSRGEYFTVPIRIENIKRL
jgi:peptidyl-prolyl cis-trans isomerase A (cyclophilin A)